ncbi:MAG TPA: aminopeptidase P family protein [Bacteroidales bacterium]|nr:aminopeptidase P family protein [Bacteroidales bacterium]
MFSKEEYQLRRDTLKLKISEGIILFPGNTDVPYNYRSNTFHFRQDSCFSYFFGLNEPDLGAVVDIEENREIIFGDNIGIEDIIWMGFLPSIEERAEKVGVSECQPSGNLWLYVESALKRGRKVHFLPPYRENVKLRLSKVLSIDYDQVSQAASVSLIKAVVEMRSVKSEKEIIEMENMVNVARQMHITAMRMARPGALERDIAGVIEGISLSSGNGVSFPVILSMNGETLHNHSHHQFLEKGRLMLVDAGSESETLYASDITRTTPVGGKFSSKQQDVYNIVLAANMNTIVNTSPNIQYKEIHLQAAKIIASGLKDLGLMKGNMEEAVAAGAHALFFPHGLGHMLGMDVHDMEGLGENYVGYDDTVQRSDQFGLAYLRFAKKPKPGFVLTDEPGIYFIPALIDLWRSEKKFTEFLNYDKIEEYKGFGGIRIEDDILVTATGCRVLGEPIPKTTEEIEQIMQ